MNIFRTILLLIGSLLTVVAVVPYLIATIKRKTKPRIVTWFVWMTLTGISCAAAFVDGQLPTAIFLLCASIGTMSVVIFGWKFGSKKFSKLDAICLLGAIIGILFWIIFNSPAIAVLATIAVDFIGGIPTQIHSWTRPNEETLSQFILAFIAAVCVFVTISDWKITAIAYPLYLVVMNFEYSLMIALRRKYKAKNKKR
jgi:hypothetical protein